ncbi:GNAT family N-acetyltransferase [Cellulomonas sp. P22]|uniref:GNAT family N-acetyltransferase n=1 Tax=Cellulomonas sp. P22 TaxID=3373189 RepID=UPI00379AF1C3
MLILRELPVEQCAEVVAWVTDPLVQFWWTANTFDSPVRSHDLAGHVTAAEAKGGRACLGAYEDGTELVAYLEIGSIDEANRSGRLERMIVAPAARGRGVGRTVVRAAQDRFFQDGHMHRLELVVASDNVAAQRCYRAAAFTAEGVLRESRLDGTRWRSVDVMGILRAEWERAR